MSDLSEQLIAHIFGQIEMVFDLDFAGEEKVIFNGPATIVISGDKKTVATCHKNDTFDPIYGYLIAKFQQLSGLSKMETHEHLDKVRKIYDKVSSVVAAAEEQEVPPPEFKKGDRVLVCDDQKVYEIPRYFSNIAESENSRKRYFCFEFGRKSGSTAGWNYCRHAEDK